MSRVWKHSYFWVLIAIFAGAMIGFLNPALGENLKPLGDGFISLVKMMIGPLSRVLFTMMSAIMKLAPIGAGGAMAFTVGKYGLALILGVDRFMSEARAIANIIGNGVATLVVSRWEKELDVPLLQRELA